MKPIHKFVQKNEIFCEILKRLLQDCEDEEGVARHALTHKVPAHWNVIPYKFLNCMIHKWKWNAYLLKQLWTSVLFVWLLIINSLQKNVCRGCGKKFNTVELLGFHEKECLQCRPHRFVTISTEHFIFVWQSFHIFSVWFVWLLRCDYCGQGFILAARLKHHRRGCHVRSITSCKSK